MTAWLIPLFWLSIATIVYTYAGYPFLLFLWSVWAPKFIRKEGGYEPYVTVVLSAFNEEKSIEEKIHNLLDMEYPEEKIEILVGSDGASDKTDEIISHIHSPRVRFFRFVSNLGKPHVLNALAEEAHGTVLVFTDARQRFERDAVRRLIRNLNDPKVGCVTGELHFRGDEDGSIEQGMGAYWRYEKFLRHRESQIGSVTGVTGAIYAIRKDLFPRLPSNILVDDMYVPLRVVERGYRAVFEREAHAYDRPSTKASEEFRRKVRTLAGNVQIFSALPHLLNPFRSAIAWQLISHKLLRLVVPFLMIVVFAANGFLLEIMLYRFMFAGQLLFYSLAVIEFFLERRSKEQGKRKGPGYLPYMFCFLNFCAVMGCVRYFSGKQNVAWERAYA